MWGYWEDRGDGVALIQLKFCRFFVEFISIKVFARLHAKRALDCDRINLCFAIEVKFCLEVATVLNFYFNLVITCSINILNTLLF